MPTYAPRHNLHLGSAQLSFIRRGGWGETRSLYGDNERLRPQRMTAPQDRGDETPEKKRQGREDVTKYRRAIKRQSRWLEVEVGRGAFFSSRLPRVNLCFSIKTRQFQTITRIAVFWKAFLFFSFFQLSASHSPRLLETVIRTAYWVRLTVSRSLSLPPSEDFVT